MTVLRTISVWLATQLDKLKVKSPVAFLVIQGVLMALFTAFATNTLNFPTPEWLGKILGAVGLVDLDGVFTTLLGLLVATVSPRTSQLKAEGDLTKRKEAYEDKQVQDFKDSENIK